MGEESILVPELDQEDLEKLGAKGFCLEKRISDGVHTRIFRFTKGDGGESSTPLACKVADSDKMPRTIFVKFFLRELDVLSRINHPNIVCIHSVLQLGNKYFIFMRYAEMGDLGGYITSKGYVKEKQARCWTRQLGTALLYLHTLAIAHRDVKCDNILITCNLNVKLTDFGFSRMIVDGKGREVHSGTFCGSLSYAAPEVIRGTKYYPRIADIWSLGVVMFAMINGFLPFKADNTARLYSDQMACNFNIRKDILVSPALREIVGSMLEPDPSNRMSLEALLRSRWMRVVPKYRQMTPRELDAMDAARQARRNMAQGQPVPCSPSTVQAGQSLDQL